VETTREPGFTALQQAQFAHLLLSAVVALILRILLDQQRVMFTFLLINWMVSILMFAKGPLPYRRIVASVLFCGAAAYLLNWYWL
jgi:hypothetical protein